MVKNNLKLCIYFLFFMPLAACETEQKSAQSSSPMVSYNEDFAKKQTQLMNEEALKKAPITGASAIMDGGTHQISNTVISDNTQ